VPWRAQGGRARRFADGARWHGERDDSAIVLRPAFVPLVDNPGGGLSGAADVPLVDNPDGAAGTCRIRPGSRRCRRATTMVRLRSFVDGG
jgi:hypothetical protein